MALLGLPLLALVAAVVVNSNRRAPQNIAKVPSAPPESKAEKAVVQAAPPEQAEQAAAPPPTGAMQIVPLEKLGEAAIPAAAPAPPEPAAQRAGRESAPPPWQAALDLEGAPPSYETIAFASDEQSFTAHE